MVPCISPDVDILAAKHLLDSMPKGPRSEKRPADVIGAAVKVMKIATLILAGRFCSR
jgi:hypothetical protein